MPAEEAGTPRSGTPRPRPATDQPRPGTDQPRPGTSATDTSSQQRPARLRETLAQTQRFTQSRIERILALVVGVGSAVIGAQSLLAALAGPVGDPDWYYGLLGLVLTSLAMMCLSMLVQRGVRVFAGSFAVVFPAAMLAWPLAAGETTSISDQPWPWFLVNVATVAALFSFPLPVQVVWCVVVPVVYGAVRLWLLGATADHVIDVALDTVFAMILASVFLVLAWMLRSLAVRIDLAREGAVRSYAQAASAEAVEKERVAVAALMHDSVLAALIAAERAETDRERSLAVTMARDALTRLANVEQTAGEGPDAPIEPSRIAEMFAEVVHEQHPAAVCSVEVAPGARPVPGRVVRALQLAAAQAIANAVEHVGGVGLRVDVRLDADGLRAQVTDTGPGFAADRIADDRLGIRASILARVAAVAGEAAVDSTGSGTVVTLTWRHRS